MEPWISQLCLRDNRSGHVKMPGAWQPGGLKDHTAHVICSEWEKHWEYEKSQETSSLPFQFTLLLLQFVLAYLVTLQIVMTNCKSNHANCDEPLFSSFIYLFIYFLASLSLPLSTFSTIVELRCWCARGERWHAVIHRDIRPLIAFKSHFLWYLAAAEVHLHPMKKVPYFFRSALAKRVMLSRANYPMSHHYLCITAP